MIQEYGGSFFPPHNLLNKDPLEYILDAISRHLFGRSLFPTLKEKAAALAYEIIVSHVFYDGNKRTGMHMAWEFLSDNQVSIVLDSTLEDLAVNLAEGSADRDELLAWLHDHQ